MNKYYSIQSTFFKSRLHF